MAADEGVGFDLAVETPRDPRLPVHTDVVTCTASSDHQLPDGVGVWIASSQIANAAQCVLMTFM